MLLFSRRLACAAHAAAVRTTRLGGGKLDFVAIDVETANANMASICQIGLASFQDGALVSEWKSYVDPEDYFDAINISIHGITEDIVRGEPVLPAIVDEIVGQLDGQIVVSHTHFDRVAVSQAFTRYDLSTPGCTWLDSARVARRTWSECSQRGYGLDNICQLIGYEFAHHDALEDAKAAGHILVAAIEMSGLSVGDWLARVEQPIDLNATHTKAVSREGDCEGPLFGEVMVFTGALEIPRREAADLAASIGCAVGDNVTRHTTLLVVGDQDIQKLARHNKSSKHRKAEQLIATGHPIRILGETDFRELVTMMQEGRGF